MVVARHLIGLFLGALTVVVLGTARGQAPPAATSAPPASKTIVDLPAQVFAGALSANAKPGTPDPAEAKKQEHLQKIKQLTFDRRPSSILKAWSTPREEALTCPESDDSAQAPVANVRRMARGMVVATPNGVPATAPSGDAKVDPFDRDLKSFQYDVTLGDWSAVKSFLAKLNKDEGKAAFDQLIQSLSNPMVMQGNQQMQFQMQMQMQMNMGMQFGMGSPGAPPPQQFMVEKNVISNQDIFGLAGAAPHGLDDAGLKGLGQILRQALDSGNVVEDFVARLKTVLKEPAQKSPLSERQAVKILFAADCPIEVGEFLPKPEKAEADNDREALNLLARHYLAIYDRDKKKVDLERAWKVTQAALATGKVERAQKEEAIRRAVELTPKIREELGRTWLEESFTQRPERGMEIIAAIGSASSRGLQNHAFDGEFRLKSLELQKLAVEALLQKSPRLGHDWASSLALLAEAWLHEAEFSYHYDFSTSLGPRMRFDPYGNVYYSNYDPFTPDMMVRQRGMPLALKVGDVVNNMPGDKWLEYVDAGMKPKFAIVFAQLYLKVSEDEKAYPYIEKLAQSNPRKAKELAEEFIRVWTKNHNPNSQQLRRSRFFYIYGFDNRSEGIPLTRSKQERNLVELADLVKRLRKLPIAEVDEKLLTQAFTTCHSTAEVYRLDALEKVFGSLDGIKPATLAELIQQMRGNLLGVWRQPAEQEKNKTKRRKKDIRAEVLRGYEVARAVVERGLARHPDQWALVLAKATIMHDENNYLQEIERSTEFAPRRQAAFAEFERAAQLYVKSIPSIEQNDETVQVFDFWFSAGLGACDPQSITEETLADLRQPMRIRATLESIAGEPGERHQNKFANTLFTRLNMVKPSIKFRYLKAGFEIVGDNPQAFDRARCLITTKTW